MAQEKTEQRKLAAIMFTDMVGYSALAQRNERLAIELLEEQRRLLRSFFKEFNGQEIDCVGDGFFVEFGSALEATRCATAIQKAILERNATAPPERCFQIRIGIHVGDVVHRDGKVMGDAVNIAARIEPLAEPGGICLTQQVFDQVHNKLDAPLLKLGKGELKNIEVPVNIYRVELRWQGKRQILTDQLKFRLQQKVAQRWAAALLLLIFGIALGIYFWPAKGPSRLETPSRSVSPEVARRITSLAVKPLDDFSGDASQAYLSDGMTEALCAALGNISGLRVPGRSSVMRYKGTQKSIGEMARELNVDAIVEGSVQRAKNHMLVTVQLVETATDRHLWSTNYERDLSEFFKVQNEVAQAIMFELKVRLTPEEQARFGSAPSAKPEAVEAYLKGRRFWNERAEGKLNVAREAFQAAISLDSTYGLAYSGLADCFSSQVFTYDAGTVNPTRAMPLAKSAAEKAVELHRDSAECQTSLAFVKLIYDWNWPEAKRGFQEALRLNPRYAHGHHWYSHYWMAMGRTDESLRAAKEALQLEPFDFIINIHLGWHYLFIRDYDHALEQLERTRELFPKNPLTHRYLGLVYERKLRYAESIAAFKEAARLSPENSIMLGGLGYTYGVAGQKREAVSVLAELEKLAASRYVSPYYRAVVHSGLQQTDEAFSWLERALADKSDALIYLKQDPWLDPLRSDPRFGKLVRDVGLPR